MDARRDDATMGELFQELARETGTLVRQEVQLAQAEMTVKAKKLAVHVAVVAGGIFLAYAGVFGVGAAIVLALGLVIPLWLSALILGVVMLAIGFTIVRVGAKALGQLDPVPRRTIETLKGDLMWAKEQAR